MKQILLSSFVILTLLLSACSSSKTATEKPAETRISSEGTQADANRQRQRRNPQQREERMNQLIAELGMDEEQATQYKAVNEKYRNKMRALRQSGGREGMRDKMMALREAQKEELSAFLTETQMEKLQKIEAERRGRRGRDGRNGRGFGGRGGRGGSGGGQQ